MRKLYLNAGFCFAFLAVALVVPASALAVSAPNPLDVSQTPSVYAHKGISPNLFLLLDNSGSMQFEYLGSNGIISDYYYGFPPGRSQPYGARNYGSTSAPGFNAGDYRAAEYRAAYVNPNYYNPATTYTPWACAASYPESSAETGAVSPITGFSCHWDSSVGLWVLNDANPAQVYLNPALTSAGFRDVEVWNDSNDSYNETSNNGYVGNSGDPGCGSGGGNGTLTVCPGQSASGDLGGYYTSNFSVVSGPSHGTLALNSSGTFTYTPAPGYVGSDSFKYQYRSCSWWGGCYTSTGTETIQISGTPAGLWPATYFNYFGPMPASNSDFQNTSNYQRVEICPATATTNSSGVSSSSVCTPPPPLPSSPQPYHTYTEADGDYIYVKSNGAQVDRTPAEEMQNFANWYQYYRSHILLADAGIGISFMQLPESFRVDYGVINTMYSSSGAPIIKSTQDFDANRRLKFLTALYTQPIPQDGTPNREALNNVGKWFAATPKAGEAPWGNSTSETATAGSTPLSCRANYTLLATDGQWNGYSPGVGNQDDESGNTITDGAGASYQYTPQHPYEDGYSSTLADVAMKYWKTDLQPGMANNVPVSSQDGAFWQHMTTFTVGLGVVPSLVQDYIAGTGQFNTSHPNATTAAAQQAVFQDLTNGTVSWPSANYNQISDTWHAAIDGHGTFASASDPTALYQALHDALVNIVNRTAAASSLAVNTEKAGQTRTQLQVFQALFHPQNWWGDVLALPVMATAATTTSPASLSVSTDATWSASCVLTGGACPQMGTSPSGQALHTITAEAPADRTVLTWSSQKGQGVAFESASLSPSALSAIGGTTILNYLRGDRSKEQGNGGSLRNRNSVMGDVVDSSPTFVGAPDDNYPDTWSNVLYPNNTSLDPENASGSTSYSAFESDNSDRENIVYVGADDGMLHAFRAGTTTNTATNDGKEVLAYVPKAVYPNLKNYSETTYTHHYFVNATPAVGDVFYGNSWHTWLVGGEVGGGDSIFALNVTHPSQFSEGNASNIVKGEWSPSNLVCANVSNCGNDLGNTFGTPVITRFNNGQWGFVFGNGFNSATGVASIYIGLINGDGSITFYELKTGYGPANDPSGKNRPDGIAYVTPVDLNGDHTADYIYAGDYFGNVWRFNVTSYNPSQWSVDYDGSAQPMFSSYNANGTDQPITTKPVVAAVPSSDGYFRIMVEFGTGSAVTADQQAPNLTSAGVQSIYGVWDWNFKAWDAGEPTAGLKASTPVAYQYAYLSNGPAGTTLGRSNLTQQQIQYEQTTNTIQGGTLENRVVSNNPVCYVGDATCASGLIPSYGWYLDLVSPVQGKQGEKVIYNPVLRNGVLIATTTIPSTASGLTCQSSGNTGWTMGLDPATGGRLNFELFDTTGNGKFEQLTLGDGTKVNTSGISLGAVGSPSFVTYDNTTYVVTNTAGGTPTLTRSNLGTGNIAVQLSWQELR